MPFDRRLFFYLAGGFVIAAIVGTVSHELGHYSIAKLLGYDARVHYAYTEWETWATAASIPAAHPFYITLAGPVVTILTGTIGLVLLIVRHRSFDKVNALSFGQWVLVFVALFWLRQTTIFFLWLISGNGAQTPDEIELAWKLGWPQWSLSFGTALIGTVVLAVVVFRFVPVKERLTFVAAGLAGGAAGFVLWMKVLGPVLLP